MTIYKPGDILVTSFPYVDAKHSKRRPVLCIATLTPAKEIKLCWVAMITSTELKGWVGDVDIDDMKKAGLPVSSIIRTAKIACVDVSLIDKKIGSVGLKTKDKVLLTFTDTLKNK